jgi:hypothetical protein
VRSIGGGCAAGVAVSFAGLGPGDVVACGGMGEG